LITRNAKRRTLNAERLTQNTEHKTLNIEHGTAMSEVKFSESKLAEVRNIIGRYPEGKQKSALIPILLLAQEEFGWLSTETMDYVAGLLQIEPIEVYEVATFYSMYHIKPVGRYMFEVCQTGPCMLNGSDDIISYIGEKLGIRPGETTNDGLFTLKTVECLGACGYAPMMQLGKYYREHLTKEKVDAVIDECRKNAALKN
jgi:NADH-quinone oxidoreductase subunit E